MLSSQAVQFGPSSAISDSSILYGHGPILPGATGVTTASEGKMENAFESWVGWPVVVQLNLGRAKVAVHGVVLNEKRDTLMMRTREGCEFEIYKSMVLAIEQERSSAPIIYS